VARRLRKRLLAFAREIGAVRNDGQADWYRVCEVLAAISMPELLEEDDMTRGPGRPKNDNELLATEVHRVMWGLDLDVEQACAHISKGGDAPLLTAPWQLSKDGVPERVNPEKRWVTRGSRWKGVKAATLVRRYYLWREDYAEHQKNFTADIP
jgi:hypothetical protein